MVLLHTEISNLFNAIIIRMTGTVGHVSDNRVSFIHPPDKPDLKSMAFGYY